MAASNLFPLGTRLKVQRVGLLTVQDRVGHSSDVDVFFADRSACVRFGRQNLLTEVLP